MKGDQNENRFHMQYAAKKISRFMSKPEEQERRAAKRISEVPQGS